jgi:hypothetical protein
LFMTAIAQTPAPSTPILRFLPFQAGGRDYAVSCESVVAIASPKSIRNGHAMMNVDWVPVTNPLNARSGSACVLIGRTGSGLSAVYVDAIGEPMEVDERDVLDGVIVAPETRDTPEFRAAQ